MEIRREIVQGSARTGSTPGGAVLLLTATLVPPADAVARSDPALRLADYAAALAFYLDLPADVVDRIVFADNSDSDTRAIAQVARDHAHDKRVEILSFAANDHPTSAGKAYGEFRLIDIAMANAQVIGPDDFIWKVTGRLKALNLADLHRAVARANPDIVCDLHNVPLVGTGRWRGNSRMDLRVFGFRPAAYNQVFTGAWQRRQPFDDTSMYGIVLAARRQFRVLPRFPRQATIDGVSGRHQHNYASPRLRWKNAVRAALRRWLPFLWL